MNLTKAQAAAATTEAHEALVIAGAGAGKTRVLIARIAHLLTERACTPDQLLVLTFTRKAAGELQDRLVALDIDLSGMLCGTFHAVALHILAAHGQRLGYQPQTMTVIEPEDVDFLLQDCARTLGYCTGARWKFGMSLTRAREWHEAEYRHAAPDWWRSLDVTMQTRYDRLRELYVSTLRSYNCLDFGAILAECQRLFREHPDVLAEYRARFKHVLVDELHDSDENQYNLHDVFAPPAAFFGVADYRQTIYTWRGARPDLIQERHPHAKIFHLNECFRCAAEIVASANALITRNCEPFAEPMIAATDLPGQVVAFSATYDDLPGLLRDMGESGYAWKDIALIARRHISLVRLSTETLASSEIPYHRVGRKFEDAQSPSFRGFHALLRLAANKQDNLAFLRACETLDVEPAEVALIRERAATNGLSLLKAASDVGQEPMRNFFAALRDEFSGESATSRVCVSLCDRLPRVVADADRRFELSEAAAWWERNCRRLPLRSALMWFSMRDAQDDLPTENVVTLITAHAAKGLEWPAVICLDSEEGVWPLARALKTEEGLAEERRLYYVAMTRARESLVLHFRPPDEHKHRDPSRFLAESIPGNASTLATS